VKQKSIPYPDNARCVSLAKASGEEIEAARSQAGLQAQHFREDLKKDFHICLPFLTFVQLSFGNHFYLAVFKAIFVKVLVSAVAILR
jgi:hypothetical protein